MPGIMKTIKEFFTHPIIQLALVSGASIIALAYVSKRVLHEPMRSIYISLPPLLVAMAGGLLGMKKKAWYTNVNYWIIAIAMTTILIIVLHLARQ
jgi:hypothetical protein